MVKKVSSASISANSKIGKAVVAGFHPREGGPGYTYDKTPHINMQELDQSTLVDT